MTKARIRRLSAAPVCAAVVILACAGAASAGTDVPIDTTAGVVQNEQSLTTVPGRAGDLMVAYNNNPTGATGLGVGMSSNYGASWGTTYLPIPSDPSLVPMTNAFDPSATADTLNNAYAAHISWKGGVGSDTGLYVHRYSYTSGLWSGPYTVNWDPAASGSPDPNYRLNDKCHVTADISASSARKDNLYLTWIRDRGLNQPSPCSDIYFATSTNQGAAWTFPSSNPSPLEINDNPGSDFANGPNAAVAPDGTVYVAWLNVDVTLSQDTGAKLYIDRSTDGGNSWTTDAQVKAINSCPKHLSKGPGIGAWDDARARSYPSIAVNPSNSNQVYCVFAEDTQVGDADEGDIYFTKGTYSAGSWTWTSALKINDDTDPAASHDQFEPWIDVKPDGTIDVAWYDRRNDPADLNWDVYIAKSTDGGSSFSANVRLSDTSFATPIVGSEGWMGEYLGLAADANNAYVAFTSSVGDTLGDCYFDSIPNVNIPEPASALVFLVGGSLLLGRRRRRA
jgi:hypothetical protein